MSSTDSKPTKILRRNEVEVRTGLSRSTIYSRITENPKRPDDYDPSFPKPVALGPSNARNSAVGWIESEIEAWIAAQIKKSRQNAA